MTWRGNDHFNLIQGCAPYRPEDARKYEEQGWWAEQTFGDVLDTAAELHPDKEAFVDSVNRLTYGPYVGSDQDYLKQAVEINIKNALRGSILCS